MSSRWVPGLVAALLWLAAVAGAAAWALPLLVRPIALPAQAVVAGAGASLAGAAGLEKLLGRPTAPPTEEQAAAPAQSRFKLLGVVAAKASTARGSGLALLAIDGKLPRAFALGAEVESGLRVLKIDLRRVELGAAGSTAAALVLELPPPAAGPGADLVMPGAAPVRPFRPAINLYSVNPAVDGVRQGPMVGVGIPGAGIGPAAPISADGGADAPALAATVQNGALRR